MCEVLIHYLSTAEQLFNLKFAAKQMSRSATKCEKEEKVEKGKLKKVSGCPQRVMM